MLTVFLAKGFTKGVLLMVLFGLRKFGRFDNKFAGFFVRAGPLLNMEGTIPPPPPIPSVGEVYPKSDSLLLFESDSSSMSLGITVEFLCS